MSKLKHLWSFFDQISIFPEWKIFSNYSIGCLVPQYILGWRVRGRKSSISTIMAPLWRSTIFGTCALGQVPKILGLGGILFISHEPLGVFQYQKRTGCHKFDEDYENVGLFQKESFLVTKQSSHGHYRQQIFSIIYFAISLDHDLGSMVVLEFRFESYFWTCNGKNMVTSPWLTYRPSAGHNWPKTQILSSTKRQQVVNLTSFDDLWYSDFRLGVEKRSLPWLAVQHAIVFGISRKQATVTHWKLIKWPICDPPAKKGVYI